MDRKAVRTLGAGLGFVGLGLSQDRTDLADNWNYSHLASLYCHPQECSPLVVLFLADHVATWRVLVLSATSSHRSDVS